MGENANATKLAKDKAARFHDGWCVLLPNGNLDIWTVSADRLDSIKHMIRRSGGTIRGDVSVAEVEKFFADNFPGSYAVPVRISQLLN